MAWSDELPLMLRYLIGDVDTPQDYSDTRLQTAILIAGKFVAAEANFSQTFDIDIINLTISPDPTAESTLDDWFSNLITTKAACQILQSEYKILTNGAAIMFKDGSATVDTRQLADNKKALFTSVCDQYSNLLFTYQMSVRPSIAAILGPINIYAGNFRRSSYVCDPRSGFLL